MNETVITGNKSGVPCVEKTTAMSVFHQEMPCFSFRYLLFKSKSALNLRNLANRLSAIYSK